MSALVIIDLQNDFLSSSAPFKVDLNSHDSLRSILERLVPVFRDSGGQIIWIKSHYALKPKEDAMDGTHLQIPIDPVTVSAMTSPTVKELIQGRNHAVKKGPMEPN